MLQDSKHLKHFKELQNKYLKCLQAQVLKCLPHVWFSLVKTSRSKAHVYLKISFYDIPSTQSIMITFKLFSYGHKDIRLLEFG